MPAHVAAEPGVPATVADDPAQLRVLGHEQPEAIGPGRGGGPVPWKARRGVPSGHDLGQLHFPAGGATMNTAPPPTGLTTISSRSSGMRGMGACIGCSITRAIPSPAASRSTPRPLPLTPWRNTIGPPANPKPANLRNGCSG